MEMMGEKVDDFEGGFNFPKTPKEQEEARQVAILWTRLLTA